MFHPWIPLEKKTHLSTKKLQVKKTDGLVTLQRQGKVKEHLEALYGGFLKWWYQTTIGFPTKNVHFGVEIGGTPI